MNNPLFRGSEHIVQETYGEPVTYADIFNNLLEKGGHSVEKGFPVLKLKDVDMSDRYPTYYPGLDNEEVYAIDQNSWEKAYHGIVNFLGTTTATFLNGTVGEVYGIMDAMRTGKFSSFHRNPVTEALNDWSQSINDKFAFYRTIREREGHWWEPENLFTANFFWDNIIRNLGFSAGTIGAGFAWGGVLKALGITSRLASLGSKMASQADAAIGAATQLPKAQRMASINSQLGKLMNNAKGLMGKGFLNFDRGLVAITGTFGEAGIEAINAVADFRENMIDEFVKSHGYTPKGADLEEIDRYSDAVGNWVWTGNVGLLSITNYVQLPKIFGSSFRSEKSLLNGLTKWGGGKHVSALPEKGFGKLIYKAANVVPLFLNAVEGFEEGSQYLIETGVQNYFNKKYKGLEPSAVDDGLLHGLRETLTTDEGWLNIFTGAFSGALQTSGIIGFKKGRVVIGKTGHLGERGFTGYGGERAVLREEAINALNNSLIRDNLRDAYSSAKAAERIQQDRGRSVRKGDILESKDLEFDYAYTSIATRVKYRDVEAVREELNYIREEASTQEGFDILKQEGRTAPTDTRESFLARLDNIERYAETVNALYESVKLKYEAEINPETKKRIYSDEVIDRLVYAASKATDYSGRIRTLSEKLVANGIDPYGVVMDVLDNKPNAEATADALEKINSLKITNDAKNELKQDLIDVIEMNLRAGEFLAEYDYITKHPEEYDRKIWDEIVIGDESPAQVVQEGGEIVNLKVGKEYSLDELLRQEDGKLFVSPKLTILSKTLGGEYEVQLPDGSIKFLKPEDFRKYKITDLDNTSQILNDMINEVVDKVMSKPEFAHHKKAPGPNKIEHVNELNDPKLTKAVMDEFNSRMKDIVEIIQSGEKIATEQSGVEKATGDPSEHSVESDHEYKEPRLKRHNLLYSSTISESEGSDDPGWEKSRADMAPHIKRAIAFLNNFKNMATRSNIRAIILTANQAKELHLENLVKLSYGLTETDDISSIENLNDLDNGWVAAIFVELYRGKLVFVDENGRRIKENGRLAKWGDEVNVNNVVFQTMPTTSLVNSRGEPRYRSGEREQAEKQSESWRQRRKKLFASPASSLKSYKIRVSKGIPNIDVTNPNHVGDILIPETKIATQENLLIVSTTDTIASEGESIPIRPGVTVLRYGENVQIMDNSKIGEKRARALFKVIEALAKELKAKKTINPAYAAYIQNVLYWKTSTPSKENQIYIRPDSAQIVIGKKSYLITEISRHENEIVNLLKDTYHAVNNNTLTNRFHDPFIEYDENLNTKTWDNYQVYLLSAKDSEGNPRKVADTPLRTFIQSTDTKPAFLQKYAILADFDLPNAKTERDVPPPSEPPPQRGRRQWQPPTETPEKFSKEDVKKRKYSLGDIEYVQTVDENGDMVIHVVKNDVTKKYAESKSFVEGMAIPFLKKVMSESVEEGGEIPEYTKTGEDAVVDFFSLKLRVDLMREAEAAKNESKQEKKFTENEEEVAEKEEVTETEKEESSQKEKPSDEKEGYDPNKDRGPKDPKPRYEIERRGQRDTKIRSKFFSEGNTTTDTEVLKKISKSSHPLNKLAAQLLKYAKGVDIILVSDDVVAMSPEGHRAVGVSYGQMIEIAEFGRFRGLGSETTLIHEIIHSYTQSFLDTYGVDTKEYKEFERLYNEARSKLGEELYGLSNIHEFMTALFSDAKLIRELIKTPSSQPTTFKSLWQEILDFILSLFGITREGSLYEDAFNVATHIIEKAHQFELEYASPLYDVSMDLDQLNDVSLKDLTFNEIEDVSNLIVNKLSERERPFVKRNRANIKNEYWYNSDSGVAIDTASELMEDILGISREDARVQFPDLGIGKDEVIQKVKDYINDKNLVELWEKRLSAMYNWNIGYAHPLSEPYVKKQLILSFLKNNDLSKYSENQVRVLKSYIPALLHSDSVTKQQSYLFTKKAIERLDREAENDTDRFKLLRFKRSNILRKYTTLLNLSIIDKHYKERIIKKITDEINRRVEFRQRELDKNPNIINVLKFREILHDAEFLSESMRRSTLLKSEGNVSDKVNKLFGNIEELNIDEERVRLASSTSVDLLSRIIELDSKYKDLATVLLPYAKQHNIPIHLLSYFQAAGAYRLDPKASPEGTPIIKNEEILINYGSDLYKLDPERLILHELIHSLTAPAISRVLNSYKYSNKGIHPITAYMNYVKSEIKRLSDDATLSEFYSIYAFTNENEFISESLTNPYFIEVLKRIPPMKQKEFANIFEEVLAWIADLLGIKSYDSAYDQLFDVTLGVIDFQNKLIQEGRLKTLSKEEQEITLYQKSYDTEIAGVNEKQAYQFVDDMKIRATQIIFGEDKLALFDIKRLTSEEVFGRIKEQYIDENKYAQIGEKGWQQLVQRTKDALRVIGITFTEEMIDDFEKSSRDYSPDAFTVDWKKYSPFAAKVLVATLIKTRPTNQEDGSVMSLPEAFIPNTGDDVKGYSSVDFSRGFSTVINKLSNATEIAELERRLVELAKGDSNYVRLFTRLNGDLQSGTFDFNNFDNNDWRLFIQFYQTFTKQSPETFVQYTRGNDNNIAGSSVYSTIRNMNRKWMEQLKMLSTKSNAPIKWNRKTKVYSFNRKSPLFPESVPTTPEKAVEFLQNLGVDFTMNTYNKLKTERGPRGRSSETDRFLSIVSGIYATLKKTGEIADVSGKTLKLEGRFNDLARLVINAENPNQDNTRFNVEGNKIQNFEENNHPSIFENEFNTSESIEQLRDKRPELNDPYSQHSVVLGKGLFFSETGERIKDFKVQVIEGQYDEHSDKGTTIPKLNRGERFMLEINHNLMGTYYFLVPADAKTEWASNIGNHITFNEIMAGEPGANKINRIFRGYLSDDVALALDWRNRERLHNVKGRGKELRFFKEVLPENIIAKITEMINEDKTLKEINDYIDEHYSDKVSEAVNEFILYTVEGTKNILRKEGKVVLREGDEVVYNFASLLNKFAEDNNLDKNKLTEEQLDNVLKFVNTNYIINNLEYHKLLLGDPYQFAEKADGGLDETKRTKSFYSPRRTTFDTAAYNTWLNQNYNTVEGINLDKGELGHYTFKSYFRTVTLAEIISHTDRYENTKEADAASFLIDNAYRAIKLKNGQWSDAAEEWHQWHMAYTRLNMPGYKYVNEKLRERDLELVKTPEPEHVIEVLKPIVSGSTGMLGEISTAVDKCAQMPLYYKALKGRNLGKLYEKMWREGIDYAVLQSGRKLGAVELHNVYKDGMLNEEEFKGVVDVPLKVYGIQVETSYDKHYDQTMGSQITVISSADIYNNGVPINETAEKTYKANIEALRALHENAYDEILHRLGITDLGYKYEVDHSAIQETLEHEMLRREMSENAKGTIRLDENGKFIIPFEASTHYLQIKDVIYSMIHKTLTSPKLPGGSKVQMTVALWEDAKKGRRLAIKEDGRYSELTREEFEALPDEKKSKVVLTSDTLKLYTREDPYCEVLLPSHIRESFDRKRFPTDESILKYLNSSEEGRKILQGIAFRIPTQSMASVELVRIKGFLPKFMGDTVIVPSEITSKTNSDFDIDKLNMYLRATYIDERGDIRLVAMKGDKEATKQYYSDLYANKIGKKIEQILSKKEYAEMLFRVLDKMKAITEEITDESSLMVPFTKEERGFFYNHYDTVYEIINQADNLGIFPSDMINYQLKKFSERERHLAIKLLDSEMRERFVRDMYTKALQNNYYDTLDDLLKLPENFDRMMNPVSDAGLENMAKKLTELRGEDENKVRNRIFNRNYMTNLRHEFLLAKSWVGIAASNITSHSFTQKAPVYVDSNKIAALDKFRRGILGDGSLTLPHNSIMVDGVERVSVSGIKNVDGEYISDRLSGYATSFVDVANNPYIMKVIASDKLVGIFTFLERIGAGEKGVMFLNQPIIREYVTYLDSQNVRGFYRKANIEYIMNEFGGSDATDTNFNVDNFESNIKDYYSGKKLSPQQNGEQQAIFNEFLRIAMMSSQLFSLNQGINYNTTKFRSGDSVSAKMHRTDIARETNIFANIDGIIENSFLGSHVKQLNSITTAVGEVFKFEGGAFRLVLDEVLRPYMNNQYIKKDDFDRIVAKLHSSLVDYVVCTKLGFTKSVIRNLLVNPETAVATRLVEAKKTHPHIAILQHLQPVSSKIGGLDGSVKTITLDVNTDRTYDENLYAGMMRELREELPELYNDIVDAILLQGVYKSAISINNIIPIEDYSKKVKPAIEAIKNVRDVEFFTNGWFQRNNFKDENIVPTVNVRYRYSEENMYVNEWGEPEYRYTFPAFSSRLLQSLNIQPSERMFLFLNEGRDSGYLEYDVVKVPRLVTTPSGTKIDIKTGEEISGKSEAAKIERGDYSYYEVYGYKKVRYRNGNPVITIDGDHVYKLVNLYGDGMHAVEYYNDLSPSQLNNGTVKVQNEMRDAEVTLYFGERVQEVEHEPAPTNVDRGSLEIGTPLTRKIKSGEKTTLVRTERLMDGIYTAKDGTLLNVEYIGRYSVLDDNRIINKDNNEIISTSDFAKTEGFNNWSNYKANNSYLFNFFKGRQDRYAYRVSEPKGMEREGTPKIETREKAEALRKEKLSEREITKPSSPENINIYHGKDDNSHLSNFAIRPFKLINSDIKIISDILGKSSYVTDFESVEQAYQYAKLRYANNVLYQDRLRVISERILNTTDGGELRRLGKSIPGLNKSAWENNSSRIMKGLLMASFAQNPDAAQKLIDTGDAILTHKEDRSKWRTEFPKLLMEVRGELKREQAVSKATEEKTFSQYGTDYKFELVDGVPVQGYYKQQGQEWKVLNPKNITKKYNELSKVGRREEASVQSIKGGLKSGLLESFASDETTITFQKYQEETELREEKVGDEMNIVEMPEGNYFLVNTPQGEYSLHENDNKLNEYIEEVIRKQQPKPKSILDMREQPLDYTEGQKKALLDIEGLINANETSYYLLAGYAGTGKTTISENIIEYAKSKGKEVHILAPTNKAAKVQNEKLKLAGKPQIATTIHRAIYGEPSEVTGEWIRKKVFRDSVILIDESSMITTDLMEDLVEATPEGFRNIVIFMGDSFQLEPVGNDPGLFKGKVEQVKAKSELTEVKRQGMHSGVLKLATITRVNNKAYIPSESLDDVKVAKTKGEFLNDFKNSIRAKEDVTMIVATNKERILVNDIARAEKFGTTPNIIEAGETIISVSNSNSYTNGETFTVDSVNEISALHKLTIKSERESKTYDLYITDVTTNNGERIRLLLSPQLDKASLYHQEVLKAADAEFLNYLENNGLLIEERNGDIKLSRSAVVGTYGYALTAHKSQGSQWEKVFVNQNYVAPSWNGARWYYTAITRSSDKLVILPTRYNTKIDINSMQEEIDNVSSPDAMQTETYGFETEQEYIDYLERESQQLGDMTDVEKQDAINKYEQIGLDYPFEQFLQDLEC